MKSEPVGFTDNATLHVAAVIVFDTGIVNTTHVI
jgi:hypothetical protein